MNTSRGFISLILILIIIGLVVLGGGTYFVTHQNQTPVQEGVVTAMDLGGGYSKEGNIIYFGGNSSPKVSVSADPTTFVVLDKDNYLARDRQHIFSFGEVLAGADVNTFTTVGGPYWKDSSHVWSIGGKGVLAEISGADARTFAYVGLPADAKDANHTYGFDPKGYLKIDGVSSSPLAAEMRTKISATIDQSSLTTTSGTPTVTGTFSGKSLFDIQVRVIRNGQTFPAKYDGPMAPFPDVVAGGPQQKYVNNQVTFPGSTLVNGRYAIKLSSLNGSALQPGRYVVGVYSGADLITTGTLNVVAP